MNIFVKLQWHIICLHGKQQELNTLRPRQNASSSSKMCVFWLIFQWCQMTVEALHTMTCYKCELRLTCNVELQTAYYSTHIHGLFMPFFSYTSYSIYGVIDLWKWSNTERYTRWNHKVYIAKIRHNEMLAIYITPGMYYMYAKLIIGRKYIRRKINASFCIISLSCRNRTAWLIP